MTTVKITRLEKEYRGVRALRGVDLDIADGEFVVLVGPSGCGKSTLLRMIAGLEDITGGTIAIDGDIVNDMQPRDRNVAMVFQDYALYPHMTVEENIGFALRAKKIPEKEIAKRVDATTRMLGIEALLKRYPRQLSGGQRQRVAIGRAIIREARLFLFDEPLSNLDAQLRDDMRAEIKRLHQELGRTMIYVTHDQIEAMTLADRIVLLRDGIIEQQGSPLNLYERPASKFVAGFLGSPKMNFIPGTITGREIKLGGGTKLPLPPHFKNAKHKDVIVGLRPQHITVAGKKAAGGHVHVPVTIELVQPTGSRSHVTFPLGGIAALAEVNVHDVTQPGEKVTLDINMNRAVLIDPQTEKVIWN
jgi:multiple sugar transport system ATP-binding protein